MPTLLDIQYFDWLIKQIDVPKGKEYDKLFEQMHNIEFVWTVPNDDNRIQEGEELRHEFISAREFGGTLNLHKATFLEVLVALSRRVAFLAGGTPEQWAWKLVKNINLHNDRFADPLDLEYPDQIVDRIHTVIWRNYREDGRGGFFPLKEPIEDQTKIEIWAQMNAYVNERATH